MGPASPPTPDRLSTGISGLDEVLQGGFISGRVYLVRGGPGPGKTTLGLHFLAAGSANSEGCLFTTLGEPEARIRQNAQALGFDLHQVAFLDLSPSPTFFTEVQSYDIFSPAEVEREPTTQQILTQVEGLKPARVFPDALTQFRYPAAPALQTPFDLRTIDGPALHLLWAPVRAHRVAEEPVFLPVLLLTTRHLRQTIDTLVRRPIAKVELQAQVEMFLRGRRLSLAFKQREEDPRQLNAALDQRVRDRTTQLAGTTNELAAMSFAISHDLRARLHASARSRSRDSRWPRRTWCARSLKSYARSTNTGGWRSLSGSCPLQTDPALLKRMWVNLLGNALKFTHAREVACVEVGRQDPARGRVYYVRDNGIGFEV